MSKDDRDQVFQTTRVRTTLKNDGSWIHKSTQEKEEQDKARMKNAVETTPVPVKQKSHVLSAAKKFDDSAKQAHGEAPAKEVSENVEAKQEKLGPNTTAENKDDYAVTPLGQSNVEHNKPKVSEDAHVEDDRVAATSAVAAAEKSKDPAEVPAQLAVKPKPKEELSTVTEPKKATYVDRAGVKSTAQPAKESCKILPPQQVAAVAEVVVELSPETPAVNNATPEGKATLKHSVEPAPNTVSKSPTHRAAESTAKSAESKVKSVAPAEPVLKARAEEVVECEVQPVKNTAIKQSIEPVPENAADHVKELNIKNALEPVTASESGALQEKLSDQAIELTDALDDVPPTVEAVPKPVNDPKQSHSERSKLNHSDDASITEKFQKPREEIHHTYTVKKTRDGKAVCSFCDQIINGNVKLTLSEPPLTCHDYCLKCGVCAKALGDLLTPMFLHGQVVHCKSCFVKT